MDLAVAFWKEHGITNIGYRVNCLYKGRGKARKWQLTKGSELDHGCADECVWSQEAALRPNLQFKPTVVLTHEEKFFFRIWWPRKTFRLLACVHYLKIRKQGYRPGDLVVRKNRVLYAKSGAFNKINNHPEFWRQLLILFFFVLCLNLKWDFCWEYRIKNTSILSALRLTTLLKVLSRGFTTSLNTASYVGLFVSYRRQNTKSKQTESYSCFKHNVYSCGASSTPRSDPSVRLTLIRMTKDEKVLAIFKGLLL
jgi:hypothetical protein